MPSEIKKKTTANGSKNLIVMLLQQEQVLDWAYDPMVRWPARPWPKYKQRRRNSRWAHSFDMCVVCMNVFTLLPANDRFSVCVRAIVRMAHTDQA